jgi:hypothetical protein
LRFALTTDLVATARTFAIREYRRIHHRSSAHDIQSLRNHLAHSQAIVAHHRHQSAALSHRLDDWMLENAGPIVDLPR